MESHPENKLANPTPSGRRTSQCDKRSHPDTYLLMGIRLQRSERSDESRRTVFEATFDAHHADVLAFAMRRVGDRAPAEDVVAETFAIAWRKREAIPDAPLVWLYAIAHRVIANQRRSATRGTRLTERLADEATRGPTGSDPAQIVEARERILTAFGRLSESKREVLRLVAWDGVDTKAGARILGCSTVAFRMRLHRARGALRRELESTTDTASPASASSCAGAAEEA